MTCSLSGRQIFGAQVMKVYLCQCNIIWCDGKANRAHIEDLISKAGVAEGGVLVLPEMFSTGFITSPAFTAERDGASLEWMKKLAKQYDCAVAGSVATAVNDAGGKADEVGSSYFNRFYFVKPDGTFSKYDKRHLFSFAGEDKRFTAGKEKTVAEYEGLRFLLQVCYDLRFPVFSRNRLEKADSHAAQRETSARAEYDIAVYVASWPTQRISAWDSLLKARAIENQCFVVGVNRVGKDPYCEYDGHSVIINPYGEVLSACRNGAEEITSADLDMDSLFSFRNKSPVLLDAD